MKSSILTVRPVLCSIHPCQDMQPIKRAETDVDPNFDAGLLTTREEFRVIKTLYLFPDIVVSAMEDLGPP